MGNCTGVVARELYDHRQTKDFPTDFNVGENSNVANVTANAATLQKLDLKLRVQFGGAPQAEGDGAAVAS